ncbi:MAG: UvrD-helicase domain-containing protein [Candidatus Alcyoniella australis]|nr:UvrD-helicase domain-containing protein [Candidatus Alcyoniella australis]
MTDYTNSPLAQQLNSHQREAVFHDKGPLLVFAGAGSGKTRVLTYRIAHLIMERGVDPWRILAVTFTNKAAQEMRERVESLVGPEHLERGTIQMGTFHSIGARLLRRYGKAIGIRPDFTIYDTGDQRALIKRILKELNLDDKLLPVQLVASVLDRAKNGARDPASMVVGGSERSKPLRAVLETYAREMRRNNALDFGDLLAEMLHLLEQSEEVRNKLQGRFDYLLVDEAQDTNLVQYRLLRLLLGPGRNICLVGDDDQSIYRWRGARVENLTDFREDFPEAQVVVLGRNYRSTKTILDAAAAVIEGNPERQPKELFTENPMGEPIILFRGDDEYDEAHFLVEQIRDLLKEDFSAGDVAIFYRTNAQSRLIEEELVKRGISYVIVGGTRFYERKEIKDLLAYARLVVNPDDSVSLLRIINTPTRGIGAKALLALTDKARELEVSPYRALEQTAHDSAPRLKNAFIVFEKMVETWRQRDQGGESPSVILTDIVETSGYGSLLRRGDGPEFEARLENVAELIAAVREYENKNEQPTLLGFLENAALVSDPDTYEHSQQAISLMTLHCAKGLEFPAVMISGLEDGLLPHSRSLDDPDGDGEERRLFYVGITRAQRRLFLTWAGRRLGRMGYSQTRASRFLRDLPLNLVKNLGPPPLSVPLFDHGQTTQQRAREPFVQHESRIEFDHHPDYSAPQGHAPETTIQSAGSHELSPGQRIQHGVFGEGRVVEAEPYFDAQRVTVVFNSGERKVFLTRWAKLKTID